MSKPDTPPNFEEIFEEFFRSFGQPASNVTGGDLLLPFYLTIQEAVAGCDKVYQYKRLLRCETCNATGAASGSMITACSACNGKGEKRVTQQTFLGSMVRVQPCQQCGGRGKTFSQPCPACRGKARIEHDASVTVQVPPGVYEDVRIRLKEMGNVGKDGMAYGDLYLRVVLNHDPRFERRGDDAILHWQISEAEYQPGRQISVPTLDGNVTMTIPTQAEGKILRLRDKGFPALDGQGRGDQFIHLYTQVWQYYLHIAQRSLHTAQRGIAHQINQLIPGKSKNKSKTMPVIDVEFKHSDDSL